MIYHFRRLLFAIWIKRVSVSSAIIHSVHLKRPCYRISVWTNIQKKLPSIMSLSVKIGQYSSIFCKIYRNRATTCWSCVVLPWKNTNAWNYSIPYYRMRDSVAFSIMFIRHFCIKRTSKLFNVQIVHKASFVALSFVSFLSSSMCVCC